jgi:hypothetical protein
VLLVLLRHISSKFCRILRSFNKLGFYFELDFTFGILTDYIGKYNAFFVSVELNFLKEKYEINLYEKLGENLMCSLQSPQNLKILFLLQHFGGYGTKLLENSSCPKESKSDFDGQENSYGS